MEETRLAALTGAAPVLKVDCATMGSTPEDQDVLRPILSQARVLSLLSDTSEGAVTVLLDNLSEMPSEAQAELRRFLDDRFGPQDSFALDRISGGQSNPTYFVTHGSRDMVLRKQPNGPILRGAHAVDREYRVLDALHPTGVPVPKPVLYHEDAALLGTPFYLMERVEGRVFADGALQDADPSERQALLHAEVERKSR